MVIGRTEMRKGKDLQARRLERVKKGTSPLLNQ